jgi:hypothetical protein
VLDPLRSSSGDPIPTNKNCIRITHIFAKDSHNGVVVFGMEVVCRRVGDWAQKNMRRLVILLWIGITLKRKRELTFVNQ